MKTQHHLRDRPTSLQVFTKCSSVSLERSVASKLAMRVDRKPKNLQLNIDHKDSNLDVRNARLRSKSSCERCISPRIPLIVSEERANSWIENEVMQN